MYTFLLRHFTFFFFLIKFYLPKPVKRGQAQAPAWFSTSESHSWGWVQRVSLESIMDFEMLCCESRAGRRQYHKRRARCWGCERQAWSSAWVNLKRGSAREEFGDPRAFCSHPPPHPQSSPSTSLFIRPAGRATKTPNILKPPQCFVLLIFPLHTDGG